MEQEEMLLKEALEKYQYEMIRITTNLFDDVYIGYHWKQDERIQPLLSQTAKIIIAPSCSYNISIEL